MTIREQLEAHETDYLSPVACKSTDTGATIRLKPETPCSFRTAFQRDRDRILHCNAFRRLKRKTQVFLSPVGDHYRTRLTHTLEVAQVARTIARALFLNEDLTEAIALGHDLGHSPFGHQGEHILSNISEREYNEKF
ncbi:MAG: HD domain-containing protein, partial [Oscillospiraceae bacterium]|nr:HD domain-containing protein [Oscillospiraceae bacterium]